MIDLSRADQRLLDEPALVVNDLVNAVGLDPDAVMLIGAVCRDILHSALGHSYAVRGTTDTDIGIAVSDWSAWERIDSSYARLGTNGVRYRVGEHAVDIMPFGGIEDPSGIASPSSRDEELVVFGFGDVYERALRLPVADGVDIRLPQPAGYAALKMRSWVDRSAYGEDKDAKDLAVAAHWYRESSEIEHVLYETEAGIALLEDADWDMEIACTMLLGDHIRDQLSTANHADLSERWSEIDLGIFAKSFVLPVDARQSLSFTRRRAIAAHLCR